MYPSLSKNSSNNQCCSSSQLYSPSNPCFCLSSSLYCHPSLQPLSLTSPHYYLRQQLQPSPPVSSSVRQWPLCRHILAHLKFADASGHLNLRLFQKMMKSRNFFSNQSLKRWEYQCMRTHRKEARMSYSCNVSPHPKCVNLLLSNYKTLSNDYPFHLIETDVRGYLRYWLSCL
jgi:hypothetical protein